MPPSSVSTSAATARSLSRQQSSRVALAPHALNAQESELRTFHSVPRRKAQKEVQLQSVISQVREEVGESNSAVIDSYFVGTEGVTPSTVRKNVSLRFPRISSPTANEQGGGGLARDEQLSSAGAGSGGSSLSREASVDQAVDRTRVELLQLRSQNEALKKNLAMLQSSVVESMKGNKAQFMGNGFFRQRGGGGGGTGLPPRLQAVPDSGAALAEAEAELVDLRAELDEQNEALHKAVSARNEATGRIKAAEDNMKSLRQASEELESRLGKLMEQLKEAQDCQAQADANAEASQRRAELLDAKVKELSDEVSSVRMEASETRSRADKLEAEVNNVRGQLEASERERERLLEHDDALQKEESQHATTRAELKSARAQMEEASTELLRMQRRAEEAECQLQELQSGTDVLKAQVVSLQEEARQWQEAAELQNQAVASRDAELGQATKRISSLAEENEAFAAEIAELRAAADAGASKVAEELRLMQHRAEKAEAEVQELQASVAELDGQVAALETDALAAAQDSLRHKDAAASREFEIGEATDKADCLSKENAKLAAEITRLNSAVSEAKREAQIAADKAKALHEQAKTARSEALKQAKEAEAALSKAAEASEETDRMRQRAETAEGQIQDLRHSAVELEQKVASLQAEAKATLEDAKKEKEAALLRSAELSQASNQVAGLSKGNAELAAEIAKLKTKVADANCDAKASAERVRVLSEEQKTLQRALEEARIARNEAVRHAQEVEAGPAKFLAEARQALVDARQNIRIMVTAPKVSVNICNNEFGLHTPFPFKAIQDAVRDEVMPKFAKVFAVSEQAADEEIRRGVQEMVEQLALSLQTKVHELMPKAEGTCNWEGFGAKCGTLSGSISAAHYRR